MFEKEAEKYAENNAYKYASDYISCQEAFKKVQSLAIKKLMNGIM